MRKPYLKTLISGIVASSVPMMANSATLIVPSTTYPTIQKAYDAANPATHDVVVVKNGTYYYNPADGNSDYSVLKMNKPNITVRAENKWGATISGLTGPGGQRRRDISAVVQFVGGIEGNGHNNILDGFVLTQGAYTSLVVGGNGNQILNCNIGNNGNDESWPWTGGHTGNGIITYGKTTGTIIAGNYIHDNGRPAASLNDRLDHGIYTSGQFEVIKNNVITGNSGHGVQVAGYYTALSDQVYNNTIANNGLSGMVLWQGENTTGPDALKVQNIDITNNIFSGNGQRWLSFGDGWGVRFDGLPANITGTILNNNLFDRNPDGLIQPGYSFTGGNNNPTLAGEPLFVTGSTPFKISVSSSAFNKGTSAPGVTTDFDGVSRPQGNKIDIGAYEAVVSNLLGNPGFELPLTPAWGIWANATLDTLNKRTGTNAVRIGKTLGSGIHQELVRSDWVGRTATLSGYGKTSAAINNGIAYMGVNCETSASAILASASVSFTSTAYTQKSASVVCPVNTTQVKAWIENDSTSVYLYADDMVVTRN